MDEKTVISLGGGTPCYANNMDLIKSQKNAVTFYLKTSLKEIVYRLRQEKGKRPIVADIDTEEALTEFVGKHLFERNPYYLRSDHIIDTDKKTAKTSIEEIIFELF
jgi:shikimate kinase